MMEQLEASPTVRAIASEIAEGIAAKEISPLDAMLHFCKLCQILRSGDLICEWHRGNLDLPETCNVCPPIDKRH